MALALFDLDNTLLAGDSDHLFGEYLLELGLVQGDERQRQNDQFYRDYQAGTLDIHAYLRFALEPLVGLDRQALERLQQDFFAQKVAAIALPKAVELIERHRQAGDTLIIITATNDFVTAPMARYFKVDHLLASEAECRPDGTYTGEPRGIPCFQGGKVQRIEAFCEARGLSLDGSYFYSDSANDIPLLEHVTHPVAVDPDPRLHAWALAHRVPIISLRD